MQYSSGEELVARCNNNDPVVGVMMSIVVLSINIERSDRFKQSSDVYEVLCLTGWQKRLFCPTLTTVMEYYWFSWLVAVKPHFTFDITDGLASSGITGQRSSRAFVICGMFGAQINGVSQ